MSTQSSSNLPLQLDNSLRGSANWLLVTAGFVLLDIVFALTGSPLRLLFNLSLLQIAELTLPTVGWLLVGGVLIAIFGGLGWLGRQGHGWAFGVGIGLYILDGGLALARSDWVNLLFHFFILVGLWMGLSAAQQLAALKAAGPTAPEK